VVEEQNKKKEEKQERILDLGNVSINTLKGDLEESKGNTGGDKKWLGFLGSKNGPKTNTSGEASKIPGPGTSPPTDDKGPVSPPEAPEKKKEPPVKLGDLKPPVFNEKEKTDPPKPGIAPQNLPVVDDTTPKPEVKKEESIPVDKKEPPKPEIKIPEIKPPEIKSEEVKPIEEKPEKPSLSQKPAMVIGGDTPGIGDKQETKPASDFITPKIPDLGMGSVGKEPPKPAAPAEGLKSPVVKKQEMPQTEANPFAAKIETGKTIEKGDRLSAVESALNYSAPEDFSAQRQKSGETFIADSKKKDEEEVTETEGGFPKKLLLIAGGGAALVIVLVIGFVIIISGGKEKEEETTTVEETTEETTEVVEEEIIAPTLTADKFLSNYTEVEIGSASEISTEVNTILSERLVRQMTQVIFLETTSGGTVSFTDLMNGINIHIPGNIIANPDGTPALLVMDRFGEGTVMGILIPSGSVSYTLNQMKQWEPTMVEDLKVLANNMPMDNPSGYFTDSSLFTDGRYALIDKASGLSLDYAPVGDYIAITFGKYSMTILQEKFLLGNNSSETIEWGGSSEESSSDTSSSTTGTSSSTTDTTSDTTNNTTDTTNTDTSSSTSDFSSDDTSSSSSDGSSYLSGDYKNRDELIKEAYEDYEDEDEDYSNEIDIF